MNLAQPAELEIAPAKASDGQSGSFRKRPLLSIVMPVRDAAGSLPAMLNAITRWIARSPLGVEVVVIDDGSSDGTRATASSFGRKIANLQVLRHVERRGRLEAIRTGEMAANGELIAFGSSRDLVSALEAAPELVDQVLSGADVAMMPFTETWMDWLRRRTSRALRDPALVVCRPAALRQMMLAALPDEDLDWVALARRAQCAFSVARREPASAQAPLLPARLS